MIGGHADLFIGIVATVLGTLLVVAAATNWAWYYSLRSARFLESKLTRGGARLVHAILGVALAAMGLAILAGFRWHLWH
jgi:small neutral amino acid transporter SnatA (MarC family)